MKLLNISGQLSILAKELARAKRREKRAVRIKDWTESESGISGGRVTSYVWKREREKNKSKREGGR